MATPRLPSRDALIRHVTPFHWRAAVACAPALPLLLYIGFASGQPTRGAIAAGAAFSVGFGAVRELRGHHWGAMAGAALTMTFAAFAGSLAGLSTPVLIGLTAVAAGACARLALADEELWWVALQATIAFLVAGYYAGPPHIAFMRAETVLVGGGVQIVLSLAIGWLLRRRLPPPGALVKPIADAHVVRLHVLRACICVALCALIARLLGLANSYWAPMTALLVLKPGVSETQTRGLERLAGTLGGCLVATLFAFVAADQLWLMLAAITVTSGLAFALQRASYAAFSLCVTATVVLFLSIGHGTAIGTAEHRIIATVLGGAIALVGARLASRPRSLTPQPVDRIGAS